MGRNYKRKLNYTVYDIDAGLKQRASIENRTSHLKRFI